MGDVHKSPFLTRHVDRGPPGDEARVRHRHDALEDVLGVQATVGHHHEGGLPPRAVLVPGVPLLDAFQARPANKERKIASRVAT